MFGVQHPRTTSAESGVPLPVAHSFRVLGEGDGKGTDEPPAARTKEIMLRTWATRAGGQTLIFSTCVKLAGCRERRDRSAFGLRADNGVGSPGRSRART